MSTATLTPPDLPPAPPSPWPRVNLVQLEVAVRWRRPNLIPGSVIANILRGALGLTLRKLVCPTEWMDHDCPACPLYASCAYGQVFQPTPAADAPQLRLQKDIPRPFVIEPPGLHPDAQPTPDGLTFQLTLFGDAISRLPFFISTLERLGHDGLGRDRVPFQLAAITARHPLGDELLFSGSSPTMSLPRRTITTEDVLGAEWGGPRAESRGPSAQCQEPSAQSGVPREDATVALHSSSPTLSTPHSALRTSPSSPRVRLRFLTPTLLKTGSGLDPHGRRIPATEVRDRPPFGVIARRIRDRLSTLCAFFGEPWQHPHFAALGTQADTVELLESHTHWLTRTRHSTRTGNNHEISGFVGEAVYEFPDRDTFQSLWPLLQFGEYLHLGKFAPWGNGAIAATTFFNQGSSGENVSSLLEALSGAPSL